MELENNRDIKLLRKTDVVEAIENIVKTTKFSKKYLKIISTFLFDLFVYFNLW